MIVKPCSVQRRCQQWGQFVQQSRVHFTRSASVFGRIKDMHGNAGIHGDGIRYDIVDGVSCRPDGGMSALVEQRGRELAYNIRCKETHDAIMQLTSELRAVIEATYIVPYREKVRSTRDVGEVLGLNYRKVARQLVRAHELIADRVYGNFQVVCSGDYEEALDDALLELLTPSVTAD